MGGYITLAFAEKNPHLLTSFGLIHSTAFADNEEKKETRRKAINFIHQHGAYAFLKTSIPNLFGEKIKQENPEVIEQLTEKSRNFSEAALVQYYNAMIRRPDRTEVMRKSEKPILFIIGSEDKAAPLSDLLHQIHLPSFAHIHIMEGIGHMSMLEDAPTLNRHLLDFITR
jgi:pimeloyl-ACP methyl ester carboxylesterase